MNEQTTEKAKHTSGIDTLPECASLAPCNTPVRLAAGLVKSRAGRGACHATRDAQSDGGMTSQRWQKSKDADIYFGGCYASLITERNGQGQNGPTTRTQAQSNTGSANNGLPREQLPQPNCGQSFTVTVANAAIAKNQSENPGLIQKTRADLTTLFRG